MSMIRWNEARSWDPFRELEEMSHRLNRVFGRPLAHTNETAEMAWSPSVNITEDDKAYMIAAELPQVKKEDVNVHFENGLLTIEGERKQEKREDKGTKFHRVESFYGKFVRQFRMPEDADLMRVEATYKDGMLHLQIPKAPAKKGQPVQIKIG